MNPKDLAEWLKKYHHGDRDWLAEQCGVRKSTVNSWFSNRPIPKHAQVILRQLMMADEMTSDTMSNVLSLSFSRQEFDAICDAALKEGKRPNQWAEDKLKEIANEDVRSIAMQLQSGGYPPKKKNGKTA
jgi:hypothetical protein